MDELTDVFKTLENGKRSLQTSNYSPQKINTLPVLRPGSDDGLPTGNLNMIGNYSITNKEFYVKALTGERLAIKRAIVHILVASQDVDPGTYGNLGPLTNGIQIIYERNGIILDATDGLPIKTQEHWGRLSYDAGPVGPYGAPAKTPFFQVRFSMTKFAHPTLGIVLEEGDRLGVRLSDDFSAGAVLTEHYIYFEGSHLAEPSGAWQKILAPLP